ncbi:MAG TPA: hypothetical protein VMW17_01920 [Candidatus Binatia bacterium]|nr:hypothetical protein [Candidatus Binatia bacterium]
MDRWQYALLVGCLFAVLAQPAQAQKAAEAPPSSAGVSAGKHIDKPELSVKKGQDLPTPAPKEQRKTSNLNSSKSN